MLDSPKQNHAAEPLRRETPPQNDAEKPQEGPALATGSKNGPPYGKPFKARWTPARMGEKGGRARARRLSAERRSDIARMGGLERQRKRRNASQVPDKDLTRKDENIA